MMVLQQTLIVDNLLKKEKIWKISLDAILWIKEAWKRKKNKDFKVIIKLSDKT